MSNIHYFIPQMEPWFDNEETSACYEYMKSGYFVTEFHKTKEFEKMICDFTGMKHCIVTTSGTMALVMSLMAIDIDIDDEVLVPDFTMIATPNSIKMMKAKPVFIDIDDTLTMSIDDAKKKITDKTKTIIYVSLNGRYNNIQELIDLCKEYNLYLIHDSAQNLQNHTQNNSFGDMSIFSFSPPKIISTGNGGAIVTNNDQLANKLRKIKDFGREKGGIDIHDEFGLNFKFTDIQAVIGIEQMKKLEWRINRMKEIWNLYYDKLSKCSKITMIYNNANWCPWFIDIFVNNFDKKTRDDLQYYLKENNIGSRPVYPPCHSQKVYKKYNNMSFPNTDKWTRSGLWLPSSTKLTDEEINYVCDKILCFFNEK